MDRGGVKKTTGGVKKTTAKVWAANLEEAARKEAA
jgi:hypothetical protein